VRRTKYAPIARISDCAPHPPFARVTERNASAARNRPQVIHMLRWLIRTPLPISDDRGERGAVSVAEAHAVKKVRIRLAIQ